MMPKRKIEDISFEDATPLGALDKGVRLRRQQLDGLLDQSKKALFRALKVARGFERQKLGRRQKTTKAENNDVDTARLDAEVAALKSLDLISIAGLHLYKTLLKINAVAAAPALPHYVRTDVESSKKELDGPSANVQARLFKSGPVQDSMADALGGVRAILGIEEVKAVKKKRLRAKDYAGNVLDKAISAGPTQKIKQPSLRDSRSGAEREQSSKTQDTRSGQEPEQSEQSEDDYSEYASRLAASSDEDSSSDRFDSEDPREEDLDPESITEDSSHGEEEVAGESEPDAKPRKPKKPPAAAPNSTTFLPSLSLGYFSGSESAEDLSDEGPQGRKNRMGQQARRALWEKKFGKNANHVKKQPLNRDEGWDARKGASAGDDRGKRGRGRGRGFADSSSLGRRGNARSGRGPTSSGANSETVNARNIKPMGSNKTKPAADAPLHPSWEAAKKAKEQKKLVAFQGKKLVFD